MQRWILEEQRRRTCDGVQRRRIGPCRSRLGLHPFPQFYLDLILVDLARLGVCDLSNDFPFCRLARSIPLLSLLSAD
jgi:hypothetical protein